MGSYKIEARFDPSKHGMKRTTASEDPSSLVGTSKPVGTAMTKVAFGVTGRCALRGRAYTDMNNNGRYDAGVDKVLKTSDLQVEWSGNDGVLGTDDDVLIVSRTSTTGRYSVENMPLGSYRVVGTERVINCSLTQAQLNDPSFTRVIATDLSVTPRTYLPKTGSDMTFVALTSLAVLLSGLFMSMLAWSRRRRFVR
jgi:LPXTG-motif cell wall-anchored protein